MTINERFLAVLFAGICLLLAVFVIAFAVISVFSSLHELIKDNATVVLSAVAAAFALFTVYINQHNHNERIRLTYKEKQLEELYYPLKTALDYSHKIDIERLEKYSYLAIEELETHISSFIERQKSLSGNENIHPSDTVVLGAIERDILKIQKDLKLYLRI